MELNGPSQLKTGPHQLTETYIYSTLMKEQINTNKKPTLHYKRGIYNSLAVTATTTEIFFTLIFVLLFGLEQNCRSLR